MAGVVKSMDSALKSMNLEKVIELTMYMYLYLHVHVHDMHVARSFSTNIRHCTMLLMFSNNYSHSTWTCIIFPNLCNTVHVVTLDTASIVAIVLQIHVHDTNHHVVPKSMQLQTVLFQPS